MPIGDFVEGVAQALVGTEWKMCNREARAIITKGDGSDDCIHVIIAKFAEGDEYYWTWHTSGFKEIGDGYASDEVTALAALLASLRKHGIIPAK